MGDPSYIRRQDNILYAKREGFRHHIRTYQNRSYAPALFISKIIHKNNPTPSFGDDLWENSEKSEHQQENRHKSLRVSRKGKITTLERQIPSTE